MSELFDQKQTVTTQLKSITNSSKAAYNQKFFWGIILFSFLVLLTNFLYWNTPSWIKTTDTHNVNIPASYAEDTLDIESLDIETLRKRLKVYPKGVIVSLPTKDMYVTLESEADYWEVLHYLNNRN
ncbi:MAG: hypothetical protein AAF694_00780 [Bacteroidota bacterium]